MKILVVTGASGGHIFPALSFLETLKETHKKIDTLLVLPKATVKSRILPNNYEVKYISISTIELSFNFSNFIAILRFLKGSLESLVLLLEFRPSIVVGFGSLDCIPLVGLAWIFRIKTLIHEQNVIPGRANRLLAKFSDRVAISFSETKDYLKVSPGRIMLTGNPIRQELKIIDKVEALSFFGFNADKFTILVMGGSQGSHRINISFLEAVSKMADTSCFQVIHLTGSGDLDLLNKGYKDLSIKVKLFTFLKEMQYAYSASNLALCRAGATTITELTFFRLPAIIVPYPFAYKHQLSNAKTLERMGTAILIKDDELDGNILREAFGDFINNPDKINFMRSRYKETTTHNANALLIDAALSLVSPGSLK